jgi:hypothetical protein
MSRLVIALLAFAVGIYVHSETNRFVDYLWPDTTVVSAPMSSERVDPIIEKSCDRITMAWREGTLSCPIPSYVQIRCWGVDEGKAHPLAQIIAHSPGN